MRIGLNAIGFVPGKCGGVETYLRNLLHYLQKTHSENHYTLLCDQRYAHEFPLHSDQFEVCHINYAQPSVKWFMRGALSKMFAVDILKLEMPKLKLDILHHPLTVLNPLGSGIPAVLTFWDMQHEYFPDFFDHKEIVRRKNSYKASTEEAAKIIVSSHFTEKCLIDRYGTSPQKISVIYSGYGPEFRVIEDQSALEMVRTKYSLDRPFMYYPAATWPHKNHHNLMAALKILIEVHGFDGDLLLTGIAMQSQDKILSDIAELGLASRVRLLGYIPADELPLLYNLARLLVFPSLFEGFGIPLVEAMACGCPVICSNATSLPEVIGDAGELIDPNSPEDISHKIWQLWNDDSKRSELRQRGLDRVRLFTWEQTSRETLHVYQTIFK